MAGQRTRFDTWYRRPGSGRDGRGRNAQIAGHAVDPYGDARLARVPQQHRDAHRMVDRGKSAHQAERQRQLPDVAGERNQQRGSAHAEEKYQHHRAPAPEISQPPRRERSDAEHQEGPGGIGHEIFPAPDAEVVRDGRYRGREHQQHQVIDRVGEVQQQRGDTPAHPGFP